MSTKELNEKESEDILSQIDEKLTKLTLVKKKRDFEELKGYLTSKSLLLYGNIAHVYFLFSKIINEALSEYFSKRRFRTSLLRNTYKEFLVLEEIINMRNPNTKDPKRLEDREAITFNKGYYMGLLNHYTSIIQRKDNLLWTIIGVVIPIIISIIPIIISVIALKISILN